MTAATAPRDVRHQRLLHIDRSTGAWSDHAVDALPSLLQTGDLLVVNDAATLPASLPGRIGPHAVELRLAGPLDGSWVVLFGSGDWRLPTEDRPAPPRVGVGDTVHVAGRPHAVLEVSPLSPRLVRLDLPSGLVWSLGSPVQYAYMEAALSLADVQTPYATRPWAVEMPSAGRPLTGALQARLQDAGVQIATLTHAAGLSATGDPVLDAALPLPERYEVPDTTWDAVQRARRVIAVGTSVVRALESRRGGPAAGVTDLRIGPRTTLSVVHGLLSGMHEPGESHFQMMAAFADLDALRRACTHAAHAGYRNHEFGDSTLLL